MTVPMAAHAAPLGGRTKRRLRAALISLLHERNYEAIGLRDLLTVADVGRSTFYAHYRGKDDLLRQNIRTLLKEIREAAADGNSGASPPRPLAFSPPLLAHIEEHRGLWRHLRGRGRDIFLNEITQLVAELVRGEMPAVDAASAYPSELRVQFLKGGFMAVLLWWIDQNCALPARTVDSHMQGLSCSFSE